MLTFNEAQLLDWVTPMLWPFLRVLALFATLPVFGQRVVPMRVRVGLSFFVALASQAALADQPKVDLDGARMLGAVMQQVIVGMSLGFAVRIVFAAIEFAGELIGLQMGLNYAGFFDPATGGQVTALSRFFGTTVSFLFIVINGHLSIIAAVVQSFQTFPVGAEPFAFVRAVRPELWGAEIFKLGLWIALPMTAMLLFVNIVLGVVSRVAQQMNIFAIGFPVTLGVGLVGTLLSLPLMQQPFTMAIERMLGYFQ